MTTLKRHPREWGEEVVIGDGARVVRIYASTKKVVIDLSQVRDTDWPVYQAIQRKYPGGRKIELAPNTDVNKLISFFMGSTEAPAHKPTPAPLLPPMASPMPTPAMVALFVEGIISMGWVAKEDQLARVEALQAQATAYLLSYGCAWWTDNMVHVQEHCITAEASSAVAAFVRMYSSL